MRVRYYLAAMMIAGAAAAQAGVPNAGLRAIGTDVSAMFAATDYYATSSLQGPQISTNGQAFPDALSPAQSVLGTSHFGAAQLALADGLQAEFEASATSASGVDFDVPALAAAYPDRDAAAGLRQAKSGSVGIDWRLAPWAALDLTAAQASNRGGLIGGFGSDPLSLARSASTSSVGLSAHVGLGNGWVTSFSYGEGLTQLELRPNMLMNSGDVLHSRTYGFAVAKHGLFDDQDALDLAVTRPLQIYTGNVNFAGDDGLDSAENLKLNREFSGLESGTTETDFELGYVTTFMDGSLALQANAGYQMNVAGLGGANALSVVSRAKINF